MSVVVRMEMPNGCHDCRLRNMVGNCPIPMFDGQDEKKSGIIGRIWTLEERLQRPPWCPIICQLPEGHGRLVDADANFLGVIHLSSGGFANYNTTIAERLGEEDMRMVKVIVPAKRSE